MRLEQRSAPQFDPLYLVISKTAQVGYPHAQLKSFANSRRLQARPNATPEGRTEKDHVHRDVEDVRGELLEIHHDRVGCKRDSQFFPRPPHAILTKDRVFQVFVVEVFDGAAGPDRLLG